MLRLPIPSILRANRLNPILKWAGGKEQELAVILPNLPGNFSRYLEPFVGGGAVFFAVDRPQMLINDFSTELMTLYQMVRDQNADFFQHLRTIERHWRLMETLVATNRATLLAMYSAYANHHLSDTQIDDALVAFVLDHIEEFNGILSSEFNVNLENFMHEVFRNLTSKVIRMKAIEQERGKMPENDVLDNYESALKSAFYMHFRHLYNHFTDYGINPAFFCAIFFFIREYCYSSMFRYNRKGEFNVPYGGIQYNRKDLLKKINGLGAPEYAEHLGRTRLFNLDFEEFFRQTNPSPDDFLFCDPPYDSDFSTYAKNAFTRDDQVRLANCLVQTPAKFMLVIKSTPFILDLYGSAGLNVMSFDKKYLVSFMNRNDKEVEHLMITNYPLNYNP